MTRNSFHHGASRTCKGRAEQVVKVGLVAIDVLAEAARIDRKKDELSKFAESGGGAVSGGSVPHAG